MTNPESETPPGDRTVVCSGCGRTLTITEPAPNGWDAITEPDLNAPGRQLKVTAWRVVFRDPECGSRTAIIREDAPQ